jgi:AcrR family transcriptional regulator
MKRPIKPASTARGEITRAKLLEAAHGLFLRRGFHGTSMRQIADAAGVAVGGIYNHFADKEQLFGAVLDAHHPYHLILPALEETRGETVEDFVRDAARRIRASTAGIETRLLPLVFTELVEFQGRHLRQLAERALPPLLEFVQRFAERRGRLRRLPRPVMLRTLVCLMIGFMLSEMALKGTPLLEEGEHDYDWFEGLVDVYLHGILEAEA